MLVSDNGPQFVSSEFQDFLQRHSIEHYRSAVYNLTDNGLVEVFNCMLKHGIRSFAQDRLSWEKGIGELLKTYQATPPTPDMPSPAERFYRRPFRLDFQPVRILRLLRSPTRRSGPEKGESSHGGRGTEVYPMPDQSTVGAPLTPRGARAAVLKCGPFHVGDLVFTRQLQALKGHSPYAGPFRVVKVIGRYSYLLSNGQKWNLRLLKCYTLPDVTWTEFLGLPLPDAAGDLGTEATKQEVGDEPHHYPARARQPPDCYTPEDFRQKKGRPMRAK